MVNKIRFISLPPIFVGKNPRFSVAISFYHNSAMLKVVKADEKSKVDEGIKDYWKDMVTILFYTPPLLSPLTFSLFLRNSHNFFCNLLFRVVF